MRPKIKTSQPNDPQEQPPSADRAQGREPGWLTIAACAVTLWSFAGTKEVDVWVFELVPGIAALAITVWVGRYYFRFSTMTYAVIGMSFFFIALGARYTYAGVPLFRSMGELFGSSRNHADRFGHFLQGLTVALMAREVFIRKTPLSRRLVIPLVTISFALAFSAMHELVEWWVVAFFYPQSGPEWLGMQGDPWDAQWDMFMALIGAIVVVTILSSAHDQSIRATTKSAATDSRKLSW